jgi:prevent-host-death family protein
MAMMAMMTLKSDEARIRMRDVLDEAVAGREVLIQRYDKPVAVVVPYEQWKAIKITEAYTEAKQILAKIKRGESTWADSDEVVSAVLARRDERLEQVIERLLLDDPSLLEAEVEMDVGIADAASDAASALAAVTRLTTLFADTHFSNLEEHLDDPLLALENADLELLPQ